MNDAASRLAELDPAQNEYASSFVDALLDSARELGASDVHVQPTQDQLEIRWRLDGVLQCVGQFPSGEATDVVTRLKVLAELLTYRTDVPQEGRIRQSADQMEVRVSTFPTLHGERAVIRLLPSTNQFHLVTDLGLPGDIHRELRSLLAETSGALLITGPAGSGKTTTAYACLRELRRDADGSRCIVSMEDPIEVAVEGISQSQVNEASGFDLATGLRSILRQDPDVIRVGEIRDRNCAELAMQAALTGHLVITTFHAGSAAEAVSRMLEMEIEPYVLRSGTLAVISQRLLRRLCECAKDSTDDAAKLGLAVDRVKTATGCKKCGGTGYRGRLVVAEMFTARPTEMGRAILSRADSAALEKLAIDAGMTTRWQRACAAVEEGVTTPAEVRRVFGLFDGMSCPSLDREG